MPITVSRQSCLLVAAIVLVAALLASAIHPYDRMTWLLEVFPVLVVLPLLVFTYRRYPLTNLLYGLVFAHAIVLVIGGIYTYARVPFGFFVADLLGSERNPYDKLGHFMQGFVPAIAAREVLVRGGYLRGRRMLAFLVICIVMAISACYELVEWGAAVVAGEGAEEFLGTQGYVWDTQSDMLMALIGGATALLVLSGLHDRMLAARVGATIDCAPQRERHET